MAAILGGDRYRGTSLRQRHVYRLDARYALFDYDDHYGPEPALAEITYKHSERNRNSHDDSLDPALRCPALVRLENQMSERFVSMELI
jgi:hypothetical protein